MIKTIIRSTDDMVIVFDEEGEQVPAYQGSYPEVKPLILKDAPPEAMLPSRRRDMSVIYRIHE